MPIQVDAVYENGVLRPLQPLDLKERSPEYGIPGTHSPEGVQFYTLHQGCHQPLAGSWNQQSGFGIPAGALRS
jgi:hypothetical protein